MAEAASQALGKPATLNVIGDTGYSNEEHASRCEEIGIVTHVTAKRSVNTFGLFDRSLFPYIAHSDTFLCPEGKTPTRKQLNLSMRTIRYEATVKDCRVCPSRSLCTKSAWRVVSRSIDDDALNRMNARATPAAMRLRRTTVEHPFGTIKYRIFGHPGLLLRGPEGVLPCLHLGDLVPEQRELTGPGFVRRRQAFKGSINRINGSSSLRCGDSPATTAVILHNTGLVRTRDLS